MTGALVHRGPDESGIYIDDHIGLGHARLSILDLSGGAQPIHNEDETLWITYNGEIFNYPELKEGLLKKGHRFYTTTDTEVVLHLYEEMGSGCLDRLNGQFAFAIWNSRDNCLFLARDRIGICPLHYTVNNEHILFASEIKAIFTADDIPRQIDPIAMDQIFTFWTTLPGRTAFTNIQELPPGHYLTLSDGQIMIRKYWDIPFYQAGEQFESSLEDICGQFKELLFDSIRIRLRADVPVGSYLSGGLDSSVVTAITGKNFSNHLRTFGIHFEEKDFDESDYQHHMVSFLKTNHTNIRITNEQIGISFPEVLWHCEKPLLRTGPVPLFTLSETVRKSGFKVVLTGEGADELIGGYNIYREAKVKKFWAKDPGSQWRPLLIRRLYPYIFKDRRADNFTRSFFGTSLDKVEDPFFSHLTRWDNTSKIKTFFSRDLLSEIDSYSGYEELGNRLPQSYLKWDYLAKAQYLEMLIFLSNYLLSSQGERVAMAHGVEGRPPFLDHRIMEFMGRVPSKWKIMGLKEKYLLKKVSRGIVPDRIIDRPKQPYRAPISQGLLMEKSSYAHDLLSEHSLKETNLFDAPKVTLLLNKLRRSDKVSEFNNMAIAGILSSQIIHDKFIDGIHANPAEPVSPNLFFDKRKQTIRAGTTH